MKKLAFILFLCVTVCVAQQKKVSVTITFESGLLKGTHTFYPEKGNYTSQINIGYEDGVSNLSASKLVSDSGYQIHYFTKPFMGEATVGKHQAKKYDSECGSLNFIDLQNNQTYNRINGTYSDCSAVTITETSKWKDSSIKKKRMVSGKFTDTLQMEVRMDDGSEETVTSKITVVFTAKESRIKKNK